MKSTLPSNTSATTYGFSKIHQDLLAVLDVYKNLSNEAKAQNVLMIRSRFRKRIEERRQISAREAIRCGTIHRRRQTGFGHRPGNEGIFASHKDAAPVDLNRVLEQGRMQKEEAGSGTIFDIDGSLPAITGHEGALNQVVLNLINATHAIQYKGPEMGTIASEPGMTAAAAGSRRFGNGISENIRDRI